jgi:glycosyltransferase involved in cell wall biosynthesis
MGQGPTRIAFVLKSFTFGGAEHDVIQVMTESDPRVLVCTGMAVQTAFPICPDLDLDHPRVPRIYQPRAVTRHAKIIADVTFRIAVKRVAANSDILICWGVENLADVIPLDYTGQIVVTSKSSGAFQESFLHPNSMLTSNYVANSVKSGEAFPAVVRHRVRVIYPGIQPQRLALTRTRDRQRKEWGMSRDDLIVGYLGRIAPDKGVEQLLDAVCRLDRRWKAVFVGRNGNFADYERQFAALCRRLLPGRAEFVDWTRAVGDALAAFDVLAYPTVEEGFANSLAEAWMLGVPTVATEGVGALSEERWAGCAVRIGAQRSPAELSRAIVRAHGNARLVEAARRRSADLTVAATIRNWQEYLVGLAGEPRRTRVMVLLPNALIGGLPSWLLTLMRHSPLVDWVCLGIVSETTRFDADHTILREIIDTGCPVFGIPKLPARETHARLLEAIRRTRPDVVLQAGVRNLDSKFPATNLPLVAVSHGAEDCDWARSVLKRSTKSASRHTAISTTAAAAYRAELRPDVTIIPNGVEIPRTGALNGAARSRARKKLGLGEREIAVGFVGRLSPEKDPVSLARAIRVLPGRYRGVFVGPNCGSSLAQIRRITRRHVYVPAVRPREVARLLPGLDVLVCLSHYESFGLAIAEAWAARVPVVSTRVGIVAALIDQFDVAVTVPAVPPAKTLADSIRRAIRERGRRVDLCRSLVRKHFTAARMGREWQHYLRTILGHETLLPGETR